LTVLVEPFKKQGSHYHEAAKPIIFCKQTGENFSLMATVSDESFPHSSKEKILE